MALHARATFSPIPHMSAVLLQPQCCFQSIITALAFGEDLYHFEIFPSGCFIPWPWLLLSCSYFLGFGNPSSYAMFLGDTMGPSEPTAAKLSSSFLSTCSIPPPPTIKFHASAFNGIALIFLYSTSHFTIICPLPWWLHLQPCSSTPVFHNSILCPHPDLAITWNWSTSSTLNLNAPFSLQLPSHKSFQLILLPLLSLTPQGWQPVILLPFSVCYILPSFPSLSCFNVIGPHFNHSFANF